MGFAWSLGLKEWALIILNLLLPSARRPKLCLPPSCGTLTSPQFRYHRWGRRWCTTSLPGLVTACMSVPTDGEPQPWRSWHTDILWFLEGCDGENEGLLVFQYSSVYTAMSFWWMWTSAGAILPGRLNRAGEWLQAGWSSRWKSNYFLFPAVKTDLKLWFSVGSIQSPNIGGFECWEDGIIWD